MIARYKSYFEISYKVNIQPIISNSRQISRLYVRINKMIFFFIIKKYFAEKKNRTDETDNNEENMKDDALEPKGMF